MKAVASSKSGLIVGLRFLSVFCGLLLGTACVGDAEPAAATFAVLDSSGVRIVENARGMWDDEAAWRIAPVPRIQIGVASGDEGQLLSEVVGAVKLSDGRIVIGDGASRSLKLYSPDGTFLGHAGRVGEGPGEYSEISRIAVGWGDSLIVMDQGLQRFTMLDSDGIFARSTQLPVSELHGRAHFLGVSERKVIVSVGQSGLGSQTGLQRRTRVLFAVGVGNGSVNRIGEILGPQEVIEASRSVAYLFGSHTEVAVSDYGIVTLSTDQSSVWALAVSGNTRLRFSWPAKVTTVTQELVSTAMEEMIAKFPAGVSPRTIERLRSRRLDEYVAPQLPAARSLLTDALGNAWVEPFPIPGGDQAPYLVFRRDGVLLGSVALPPGLKRGTVPLFDPALEIGEDYVLGVWVDDFGVEQVREYRLVKPTVDR